MTVALIASALAWPSTAAAQPASEAAVSIEVDVSALPKEDRTTEYTRKWVLERQTTVFEGEGFPVSDGAGDVVRIEISRYGDYGANTRARLSVAGNEASLREFTCEACTDAQFLGKVEDETTQLALWLHTERARAQEPASEPEPTVAPKTDPTDEAEGDRGKAGASEAPVEHQGKRLGSLGYAGIASLALGVGMTVGGVVVLAEDPSVRIPPEDTLIEEVTSRRPLGAALAGVGGALVVSGVVMIVVDQTILRKRRSKARVAARVRPSVSTAGVGVSLIGRF